MHQLRGSVNRHAGMGHIRFPEKLVAAQKYSFMVFVRNYSGCIYMGQLPILTKSNYPDI
jgi:hypothetical protein